MLAQPIDRTVQVGVTSSEPSALEELAAARLRGAKPEELLQLGEAAVDHATVAGDTSALKSIAAELDSAAPACRDEGDGLRLRLAAKRARAMALRPPPAITASEEVPVPRAAEVAFWVTVWIAALALLLVGVMARQGEDSGYGIAFLLLGLLVLGSLFVGLTGAVGLVKSVRAGSRKGTVMSAIACGIVLLLIVVRIGMSLD